MDVNAITRYVTGRLSSGFFKGLADMNGDESIDIVDLTLITQKIVAE